MHISNPTAKLGEDLAAKYLKGKGYKIIDRNLKVAHGEIDIISIKDNILVFVEVKTRTTMLFGGAINSISNIKLKNLIKASTSYKAIHPSYPDQLRIDAIFIDINEGKKFNLKHNEDITS